MRWILYLAILCAPVALAVVSAQFKGMHSLPHNGFQLAFFLAIEFLIWGMAFFAAFRTMGITPEELRIGSRRPLGTLGYGLLWFVTIRIASSVVMAFALRWMDPNWLWATEEKMLTFIDAGNITRHPAFSLTVYGLASLIAGLTEELWRAGMLAGLEGLFPGMKKRGGGVLVGIIAIAVVFGLAHLYQGWVGMGNAVLLGFFLGLILVYRKSYWEAAIAHTLYDAFAFGAAFFIVLNAHGMGTTLVYNAAKGNLSQVKQLVSLGVDVNSTSDAGGAWKGITALEYAAQLSDSEMVRYLLDKRADPNLSDSKGQTPLIIATERNRLENVKLLVAKGADLNRRDKRGFTALRSAAEYNRMEVARVLIEGGADMNLPDSEGITPLAAAGKWGYSDLVALLRKSGAK